MAEIIGNHQIIQNPIAKTIGGNSIGETTIEGHHPLLPMRLAVIEGLFHLERLVQVDQVSMNSDELFRPKRTIVSLGPMLKSDVIDPRGTKGIDMKTSIAVIEGIIIGRTTVTITETAIIAKIDAGIMLEIVTMIVMNRVGAAAQMREGDQGLHLGLRQARDHLLALDLDRGHLLDQDRDRLHETNHFGF